MKVALKGRKLLSWITLLALWGAILAGWLPHENGSLALTWIIVVLLHITWMSSFSKGWKMRSFSFVAILFTVFIILPFSLFMFNRIYEFPAPSVIASATDLNPFIRSDAEVLGNWSGPNKTLVLSADKTFKYQTLEHIVTGNWARNDFNLYLKGNSDGCCNNMRFVTLHKQYFLLTDDPDFSEVEGHGWLDDAIASAFQKVRELKPTHDLPPTIGPPDSISVQEENSLTYGPQKFPKVHSGVYSSTLTQLKECAPKDEKCNPFDTPENRAVFDKKKAAPAAAPPAK